MGAPLQTAGYLLAADIGGTRLRMMLAAADGTPVERWAVALPEGEKHPDGVLRMLQAGSQAMLASVPAAPLLHATVGAPGVTDVRSGTVLAAPNLPGWTAVPLQAMLEDRLGIPAAVDNDTNLAALGEGAAGAAEGHASYIFVAMGTGVGAGIVQDGKLLRGANGTAGEIGYLRPPGQPYQPVRMNETGSLEQQIGGLGIELRWREVLLAAGRGRDEALHSLRAPQVFDRADAGDTLALKVMRWTADLLSEALLTVTLVLDPALIVLGGGVGAHPGLCAAVSRALGRNTLPLPQVRPSALGTEAQLHGAIAVSLAALPAAHRC